MVAVLIVYTGARGYAVAAPLQKIVSLADSVGAHARAGDISAVAADLREIDRLASDSASAAGDPMLAAASALPLLGDDVSALTSVSRTAANISSAAAPLVAVLPKLESGLVGTDGRIDITAVASLADGVTSLSDALDAGQKTIAGIDRSGLVSQLGDAVAKLDTGLTAASAGLSKFSPIVRALPILLGESGQRDWLVIFQNLSEARGTGGLISAWASLTTDRGKLVMHKVGSNDVLAANDPVPQTGLPEEFVNFWGNDATQWLDMNTSAHFPYTGQLAQNGWKKLTGQTIDGVVTIGQGVVQTLIAATGAITVRGYEVTPQNAESFLSKDIYAAFPDVAEKDAVVSELIGQVFTRISTGKLNFSSMVTSAFSSTTTDRMLMWSSNADDEKLIVKADVGGIVPTTFGPTAVVAINNGGGNKLEAYLHTTVDYALQSCGATDSGGAPARNATLTVTLTNSAPAGLPIYVTPRGDQNLDGVPRAVGSNREYLSVYLPVGAEENGLALDGELESATEAVERDRVLVLEPVEMAPGQTRVFTVKWLEPSVEPSTGKAMTGTPTVLLSPLLNDPKVTAATVAPCPVE